MRRIGFAVFLLLTAIVLYLILHDIDSLYVFYPFRATKLYTFIKSCKLNIMQGWISHFATCYLIDALWFSSFLLLISCVGCGNYILKYIGAICFAFLTEILQLFIRNLGTFDIYDVLLYGIIAVMGSLIEIFLKRYIFLE